MNDEDDIYKLDAIPVEGCKLENITIQWKLSGTSDANFMTIHPQDTSDTIKSIIAKEIGIYPFRIKLYYNGRHFSKNSTALQSAIGYNGLITVHKEEYLISFLRIILIIFIILSCIYIPISIVIISILFTIIFFV